MRGRTHLFMACCACLALGSPRARGHVLISEFMAVNHTGAQDEDGDRSDWIELFNAGTNSVNLGGWHLTDDAADLTKWTFYPLVLEPNQFLVVRASNKNRKDPEEELHTNFKLSGDGEYLALVKPDGSTVADDFGPAYPPQTPDVSYGRPYRLETHDVLTLGAPCSWLVPTDGSLGTTWVEEGFDDASWTPATTGLGYERASGYEGLFNTDVESAMYGKHTTMYVRVPFVVPDGIDVDHAVLRLRYDDGFRAYMNGDVVALGNIGGNNWDEDAPHLYESEDVTELTLSSAAGLVHAGTNMLAIHCVNEKATSSDLLLLPELRVQAYTRITTNMVPFFFTSPTPGSDNLGGAENIGPRFFDEQHLPAEPLESEDLTVTVRVNDEDGVASVQMIHEVMYDGAITNTMSPLGGGVYHATLSAAEYAAGEMIRYRFVATDGAGHTTRWPAHADPLNSPESFGTMAQISVSSSMPVYHWFVEDEDNADTKNESRSALFYNGVFYDNIMTRVRGASTATAPKPNHKFDFNRAHHFEHHPDFRKIEEMNLNTTYTDKTYLRRILAWNAFKDVGQPACHAFLVHLRRNNQFYGVQTFEEQVDEDFLIRHGYDPNGALYKMQGTTASDAHKRTREWETSPRDIEDLIGGIQGGDSENYLFDHTDLANFINYLVMSSILRDGDNANKNHYYYRDSDGDGDWSIFAWDKDLTLGMNWTVDDTIFHDDLNYGGALLFPSWGYLVSAFNNSSRLKNLYLRRLRTVSDQLMGTGPGGYYETRITQLLATHGSDLALDYQTWGNPWSFGDSDKRYYTAAEANQEQTLDYYLPGRRSILYNGVPSAQPADVSITISHVEVTPSSGNQLEEYIELTNPNNFAVDLSGWSLSNAVTHVFRGGSVVPANGKFYVSPNTGAFRGRTTGPRGGQKLFVQGSYQGMLSSRGETLELYNENGVLKDTETWGADLSDAQRWLRVSEVMYHPAPPGGSNLTEDRLEFIELMNTGAGALDIGGTFFTAGVVFTNPAVSIPAGGRVVIASDPVEFANQYDAAGIMVIGPFDGFLSNGSDELELEDDRGETIQRFKYKDWYRNTDGRGFSLTLIDPAQTNLALWNEKGAWRPSLDLGGSPGTADVDLATGAIVINEILAHSDTGGDWVELKNQTATPVDVSHWFLSDDRDEPYKFQIPPTPPIPAGGWVVFTESQFNTGPNAFAFSELGDEAVLTKARADGTPQGYQVIRAFDATGKDRPLGRWTDSEGDTQFIAMDQPTPGAENSAPKTGPVLVSEIMYAPAAGFAEYIELHNASASAMPLRDLAHPTNGWALTSAIDFSFADDAEIGAYESIIICSTNPAAFRAQYGVAASTQVLGPYAGRLDAAGERLKLYRPGNPEPTLVPQILVESVNYKPAAPWPAIAPGSGFSIERVSTASPANDPASWKASPAGGTPGAVSFALTPMQEHLADWTALYFGEPPPPNSGALEDYDLDGRSNHDEWIEGTNPTNAHDAALVQIAASNGIITVWINTRATDPAIAHGTERYYSLECKTNLLDAAWIPMPDAADVWGTNQVLGASATNEPACFIRARIELH